VVSSTTMKYAVEVRPSTQPNLGAVAVDGRWVFVIGFSSGCPRAAASGAMTNGRVLDGHPPG
jgi:hypothetical protein